jgi:hypothetical protein
MSDSNGNRVTSDQRYSATHPCPICGHHEGLPRGRGERCTGYLAGSGKFAFCSRVESGETIESAAGPLWKHRLDQPDRLDRPRASANGNGKPKGKGHRTPQEAVASLARWMRREKDIDLGKLTGDWTYHDSEGRPVLVVYRFDGIDPETGKLIKTYRPVHRGDDQRWRSGDPEGPLPLYHLPELAEADLVVICEGEKAADAVRNLGLVTTSPSHGSDQPHRSAWSPLAGKAVAILPDNDEPGRKFALDVAELLHRLDPRPTVKVVELPGLPPKGDAVEWVRDLGGTGEHLQELIEAADVFEPPSNGNGKPPTETATAGAEDDRPVIEVTTERHDVNDRALEALAVDPAVFQRGGMLVTVIRDPLKQKGFTRPPDSPRIAPIPSPRVGELLTRRARFVKEKRTRDGEPYMVPDHPPDWCILGLLARGEYSTVRPIEGVVECPTLRPDGSVLETPGYDDATGLLYEPNGRFPKVPERPSRDDARAAADELLGLVQDFPFVDKAHGAVWLAALLTPLARFAIDGPCPLFLFDANSPGTGKSKLCDLVAIAATGREMARSGYPEQDVEMDKVLTAVAMAGDRVMMFDDIGAGGSVGGKSLDRALTARTYKGRILGRSQMTAELPMSTIFYATGNNIGMKGDALRRVIPCRLESTEERPEERCGFAIPDILGHAREHRGRIVAAALTILRGHAVAGRPDSGLIPMDYPAWCRVVRDAVQWATGIDPAETRRQARENDPEANARRALVTGWAELPGADEGLSTAEAIRLVSERPDQFQILREVLIELSRNSDLPGPKVVSKRLSMIEGRVIEGLAIRSRSYQGTKRWRVENTARGIGGIGGIDPESSREKSASSIIAQSRAGAANQSHEYNQSHGAPAFDPTAVFDPDDQAGWGG